MTLISNRKKNDLCLTSWLHEGKPVFGVSKWTGRGWKPLLNDEGKTLYFSRSEQRNDYVKSMGKNQGGASS